MHNTIQSYEDFIASKRLMDHDSGFDVEDSAINQDLFPFQRAVVKWALRRGRAAVFGSTGTGKTPMQLEWARHVHERTGGNVLIFAPLAVSAQTKREGEKFNVPVNICRKQKDVKPGINITNYEMLEHFDQDKFTSIVLDECFPPDTPVDVLSPNGSIVQKPIQSISKGEYIRNAAGKDKVYAIHKRQINRAVRVHFGQQAISCSENHPFFTMHGWRCAQDLQPGDYVMETEAAMRLVRGNYLNNTDATIQAVLQSILLSEMEDEPSRTQSQGSQKRDTRENREKNICLVSQRFGVSQQTDRKNQGLKSDDEPRYEEESVQDTSRDGTQTFSAWGKWEGDDYSPEDFARCFGNRLDSGICYIFGEADSGISNKLQSRLRESRAKNSNRGGWLLPPQQETLGREKGRQAGFIRVDGLEVLEQGSFELEKYRDDAGNIYFYDIEAERHPSFSIAGILVHNSSIVKSYSGKFRRQVTLFAQSIPYRLACTATPAPNDTMEIINHAEFLGIMSDKEVLALFFTQDFNATSHKWRLKGHARKDFWIWLASWARAFRTPQDLGFKDDRFILPPLHIHQHVVETDPLSKGNLFAMEARGLTEEREARRITIDERVAMAAKLTNELAPDEQWIVWTDLNEESAKATKAVNGAVEIRGSDSIEHKEKSILDFVDGTARCIVSKPQMFGFGLNLQNCSHMVYVGMSHCYDEKTELLTKRGWLTFGDVRINDTVGTINPNNGFFEWQNPSNITWEPYFGDMVSFNYRAMSLVVTPNHDLWVKIDENRYPNSDGCWFKLKASELVQNYKRMRFRMITVASGWLGSAPEHIEIPKSPHVHYDRPATRRIGKIPVDVFCRLIGWYLSEGCVITRKGKITGTINICQTEQKSANRADILETLSHLGIPVNQKTKDIHFHNIELAHYLAETFGMRCRNLFIPQWVKDFPVELLRVIWDRIMAGDGMHDDGALRGLKSYSKMLIDDCQEIALKLGISTSNKFNPHYTLGIRNNYTEPWIAKRPQIIKYDGYVGCVSVPNGLLVVRRDGHAIISGNSFERYFQSIRRCWRFGQTKPVHVHVITSDMDGAVVANIERKEKEAEVLFENLVSNMHEHQVESAKRDMADYSEEVATGKGWTLYLGDSVETIKRIESESVGLTIFSPPFPGMYVYTNDSRDMGNVKDIEEMVAQFRFLIPEMLRITMPGRSCCIHLTQGIAFKHSHGHAGLLDFRGAVISAMQDGGWIYYNEVTISKNPQLKALRTKDQGLLFKTLATDAAKSRMAMADYLLQFRKPGENPQPIKAGMAEHLGKGGNSAGWITNKEWVEWASPVWLCKSEDCDNGISESDVLNAAAGRDADDEKHLCPLQLPVVERAVKLWSNPGDIVYSPFAGIGSEGYQALLLERQFVGGELKRSYWEAAIRNLRAAEDSGNQASLFD